VNALQENFILWIHLSPEKWVLGFSEQEFLDVLKKMKSLDSIKNIVFEGQGAKAITTRGLISLKKAVQICFRRGWTPSLWVPYPLRIILEKIGLSRLVSIQMSPKVSETAFLAVSDMEKDWLWGEPE